MDIDNEITVEGNQTAEMDEPIETLQTEEAEQLTSAELDTPQETDESSEAPAPVAPQPVKKKKKKKKRAPEIIYERSKAYPLFLAIMMYVGVVVGVVSWFPTFNVMQESFLTGFLGLFGGGMAILSIVLMIFTVKCPACGSKKLGRTMGAKVPKQVECPDCHKKVNLK